MQSIQWTANLMRDKFVLKIDITDPVESEYQIAFNGDPSWVTGKFTNATSESNLKSLI